MSAPAAPAPDDGAPPSRFDAIATDWSLLRRAGASTGALTEPARHTLVLRYRRAIRRYLVALLQNETDAEDVAQDVLRRILDGKFAKAEAARGRFRHYLKQALRRAAGSFVQRDRIQQERRKRWFDRFRRADDTPLDFDLSAEQERQWLTQWRLAVLEHTFERLEDYQREHPGCVYVELLRARAAYPDDDNQQLAGRLLAATGPLKNGAFRALLMRARRRFAELLLEEVAAGLDDATPAAVEEELVELGLLELVRDFLPPDWRTRGELCDQSGTEVMDLEA